jgi:hypothetical protein
MKKIIACVIISQLFLFCTSEDKQYKIYIIDRLSFNQAMDNDNGNCNEFNTATVFGDYWYSGRGLDGKLEYEKGWDWMNKIRYDWTGDENIRFNNQYYINEMDKLLFDQEFILMKCQLIRNVKINQYDYESSLSRYKIRLNGLRRFMVENSDYFDSEVLKYVNQKIEESRPK